MVPLTKIDTTHVLKGSRTRISVAGMDKPGSFLLDGGPEFNDKIRQAIRLQAWNSKHRVHAPHHHESAGKVEIFKRSIKKQIGLLKHGTNLSWLDVYNHGRDRRL